MSLILKSEIIKLNERQLKIVKSGWGENSVEDAIVKKITYLSDGLKIKGFLAHPKNIAEKLPVIIWCRGGFGDRGRLDSFSARGLLGEIASWGYVVLASQYRGKELDEFGGRDLNDVVSLVRLTEEIDFADKEKMGIEGWSRGGMMTYLMLTKLNIFKASVVVGGISDLKSLKDKDLIFSIFKNHSFEGNIENEKENFLMSRSAINFADKISKNSAILIIHGAKDERVPVENSIEMAARLIKLNRKIRLTIFEEGDHFLKKHRREVSELKKFWFNKFLKGEKQ